MQTREVRDIHDISRKLELTREARVVRLEEPSDWKCRRREQE